jgi:hypothetical protein
VANCASSVPNSKATQTKPEKGPSLALPDSRSGPWAYHWLKIGGAIPMRQYLLIIREWLAALLSQGLGTTVWKLLYPLS